MTAKDMIWELRRRGWLIKQIAANLDVPYYTASSYSRGITEPPYSVGKRLEELMEVPIPKSNVVHLQRKQA